MTETVTLNRDPFLPLEYGPLKLPQLSRDESSFRSIEITPDALFRDKNFKGSIEALKGLKGSQALRAIHAIAQEFAAKAVEAGKVETSLQTHAVNAIRRTDWSGVDSNSPERFVLREAMAKTNRLRFALIKEWIEKSPDTGLSEIAKGEYLMLLPALAAADLMHIKLMTEGSPIDTDERVRRGMKSDYSVVRIRDGEPVEVPMHRAYPEESRIIAGAYRDLVDELALFRFGVEQHDAENETLYTKIDRKIKYYEAVAKAFETSDPNDWLAADTLLTGQIVDDYDVTHYHPIEDGYWKEDRIIRGVEIIIRIPDEEGKNMLDYAMQTRARMILAMQDKIHAKEFADISTMADGQAWVEKSRVVPRVSISGGAGMDFKAVGQALPNDAKARLEGGMDVSLDLEASYGRQEQHDIAFTRIFGEEAFNTIYKPRVNQQRFLGTSVTSHELGHLIGQNATTDDRLGKDFIGGYPEEDKATENGFTFSLAIPFRRGEVSIEDLRNGVVDHLGRLSRSLLLRNQANLNPYTREAIMLTNAFAKVGIITFSEGNERPQIHLDDANLTSFAEDTIASSQTTLEVYADGARQNLTALMEKRLRVSPLAEQMARLVEDPLSNTQMPTLAEIATLPAN